MTEPTDAELLALIEKHLGLKPRRDDTVIDPRTGRFHDVQRYRDLRDDILAKFGTPPAVAPWRSAVLDLIDDCPGLTLEQDRWLSRRVKELDFASTPQPTQAQAGAVPLYRLLQSGVDRIEAADEFLSDDTTTWAIDPNGIFSGNIYGGHVLRPARRRIKGGQS